jgi:phosphohistidine swiveling domain-containing protein
MSLIVPFPRSEPATIAEVGGKGLSLIRLAQAGLPVPPGAILTTGLFLPWFEKIKASATWSEFTLATPDHWAGLCGELKKLAADLSMTDIQNRTLDDLRRHLATLGENVLFAVRSSSPDEDLESASFAGGYETRLGVRPADLEDAIRHCFASSLDERVFVYKKEHGFDIMSPSIAVIVQTQIDSQTAGVGFSINPLTNDFDEAVINANWGLGETVVAGTVSPDHFIVDKVDRKVVEKNQGDKKTSIRLNPNGGVTKVVEDRPRDFTLNNAQILELADMICRIEELYEMPMDIEWAYADHRLYVLQARPITTFTPLPPEMITQPHERRRLYMDISLSGGLTTNAPISPLGLDLMENIVSLMFEQFLGPVSFDTSPSTGAWFFAGGRMYQNLSNVMRLSSLKSMSRQMSYSDALMSETLANIDAKQYRSAKRPPWAGIRMVRYIPRVLWRLRWAGWNLAKSVLFPERAYRIYQDRIAAYESKMVKDLDYSLPLGEFLRKYFPTMAQQAFYIDMPAVGVFFIGLKLLDLAIPRKSADQKALPEKLKVGFSGNIVVEMGLELFRMAKLLNPSDFMDLPSLAQRITDRQMPEEFLRAWDGFIEQYGWRGPLEMDLASPRYADDPKQALRQMSFMDMEDKEFDPEIAHAQRVDERWRAYNELLSRSGWFRRILLRRAHKLIDLFAGTRDNPKHHILLFYSAIRKRVITEGQRLVKEGRLDSAEHVFDLTFSDLPSVNSNRESDLREIRKERTRFINILKSRVREFPPVIDSRGRILRPPPLSHDPNELQGMAVSPGKAVGPIKILHNPYEKAVNKGDVLVAHTTDPGWTPLFVNAAAVVLEVGGVLQHGAVVAREYGKPCVAGIDGLVTKFKDGQMVAVDGTVGTIRIL